MSVLRRALRACIGNVVAGAALRRTRWMVWAGLSLAPALIHAQAPETSIYDEQGKLLRGSEAVASLGPDLFGDQVSLYTGSLEFVQTDVSLPGNNALPVAVGRRFTVADNGWMRGHFGDWDLEVPRVHGVFSQKKGWSREYNKVLYTNRCSDFGVPPTMAVGQSPTVYFAPDAYWQGTSVYIPGQGDQEILKRASTNAPPTNANSSSYTLTTKSGGMIRCIPLINGGSGEGFELLTPDGTKYTFNHMIERAAPPLKGGGNGSVPDGAPPTSEISPPEVGRAAGDLNRKEFWIVATQVTDRHGNTVNYNWSGWQLLSISDASSGGRSLSLTYYAPPADYLVNTVTATVGGGEPARIWTYLYSTGLHQVQLPGGQGSWTFNLLDLYLQPPIATVESSTCDFTHIANKGPYTGTLTHPNGAVGTFSVATVEHGRTSVERNCMNARKIGTTWHYDGSWARQPVRFPVLSLASKTITGPGLPSAGYQWLYNYNDNVGMSDYCWDPTTIGVGNEPPLSPGTGACTASSPMTKIMRVTEVTPGLPNVVTRYTFGIKARANEGQLLKTEFGWDGTTAQRTVETTYYSYTSFGGGGSGGGSPAWPTPLGESILLRGDTHMAERLYPETKRLTLQDGAGHSWEAQSFDHRGRPTQVTRSRVLSSSTSRTETTTYHDNTSKWVLGQVATLTQRNTAGTLVLAPVSNTYDATTANLLSHSKYGQLYRSYQWNADGTLWKSTDNLSKTTTYTDYKRGVPRMILYHNNDTVLSAVNDTGEITAVTQAGHQRLYKYDDVGRLTRITYPTGDSTAWSTTELAYQQGYSAVMGGTHLKQTVTTQQASGRVNTRIAYLDALLRPALTEEYDSSQKSVTLSAVVSQFDAQGRPTYASYPQRTAISSIYFTGPTGANPPRPGTTTRYDAVGRVAETQADTETIPGVAVPKAKTTITYDANGKRVVDPRGNWTRTFFQMFDEPTEDAPILVEDAKGSTTITRDVFSRMTAMTRGSITRQYVHDANNRLCKTIDPETSVTIFDYDAAGNLAWKAIGLTGSYFNTASNASNCQRANVDTYAYSAKTVMAYDARNRLWTTTPQDGSPRVVRTWTADNLPETVKTERQPGDTTSLATEWEYLYDKRRLLRSEKLTLGADLYTFAYQYDPAGHRTQMSYPDFTAVSYNPNALGQPQSVGSYASLGQYHANGGLWQFRYGNTLMHYTYQNLRGLPNQVQDGAVLSDLYSYDLNGNVSKIADGVTGEGQREMQYDSRNRLTMAKYWGSLGLPQHTIEYDYDALDNVTKNIAYLSASPASPNRNFDYTYTNNRLVQIYDPIWSSTQLYTYNDRGQTTTRSAPAPIAVTHQYHYDLLDRLNRVSPIGSPNSTLVRYDYDGHGRRVRISESGATARLQIYTQAGQLAYEKAGTDVTQYYYLGRHLVAKVVNGAPSYQHTDGLGTPVLQTDASQNLIAPAARRNHEPYGEPINKLFVNGPDFTGHVMDSYTRLIYMQARYYDPIQGRFLSTDPVEPTPGGFNRYWYANNNPYMYVDPDGRNPLAVAAGCAATPACAGAVIAGAGTVMATKKAMENTTTGAIASVSITTVLTPLAMPVFEIVQQSVGGAPDLPEGLIGENPRATGKNGGTAIGTSLPGESFPGVLEGLTGGTLGAPDSKGRSVAPNGVGVRVGGDAGPRIDIPANGTKPPEIIHFPPDTPVPESLKPKS